MIEMLKEIISTNLEKIAQKPVQNGMNLTNFELSFMFFINLCPWKCLEFI